jgi:hypothetical protein
MSAQVIPFPRPAPRGKIDPALLSLIGPAISRAAVVPPEDSQALIVERIEQIARNLGIDLDAPFRKKDAGE